MREFFCYRRHSFHSNESEHRLLAFGESYEDTKKDPCPPEERKKKPEPPSAPAEPEIEPEEEPDFDAVKVDFHPEEPSHIYDAYGNVVENTSDDVQMMTRREFKQHLQYMFGKHMKLTMREERDRQHRLARGRRRAEARRRFSDYKSQRKWGDKVIAENGDKIYDEAEEELNKIAPTPEQLFGRKFEKMLESITNAIWSSAEFQRGTVDYLKAYSKAWTMYMDLAERTARFSPLEEHPLFQSGTFRNRRAPGTYQNGRLRKASSNYIRFRPNSSYAGARIRERAGVSQNPEKDFIKGKEANVRAGYERGWRHTFRKRNPLGSTQEENAYIDRLVQGQMRKDGYRQDELDRARQPDKDLLRLPDEADRKDDAEYLHAFENIDLRDRGPVVKRIISQLGLRGVKNLDDLKEKGVHIAELKLMNMEIGIPQMLHFSSRPKKRRGEVQTPSKAGLALIDREEKNANLPPEITMIDFGDVDALLNDKNPWRNGFLKSSSLKDVHRGVRTELKAIAPFDRDAYSPAVYQRLIPKCREKDISKFALDQLPKLCEVSNAALSFAKDLETWFKDIKVLRQAKGWSVDQKKAVRDMVKASTQPEVLEAILKQHCLKENGGDLLKDEFETLWHELSK